MIRTAGDGRLSVCTCSPPPTACVPRASRPFPIRSLLDSRSSRAQGVLRGSPARTTLELSEYRHGTLCHRCDKDSVDDARSDIGPCRAHHGPMHRDHVSGNVWTWHWGWSGGLFLIGSPAHRQGACNNVLVVDIPRFFTLLSYLHPSVLALVPGVMWSASNGENCSPTDGVGITQLLGEVVTYTCKVRERVAIALK